MIEIPATAEPLIPATHFAVFDMSSSPPMLSAFHPAWAHRECHATSQKVTVQPSRRAVAAGDETPETFRPLSSSTVLDRPRLPNDTPLPTCTSRVAPAPS